MGKYFFFWILLIILVAGLIICFLREDKRHCRANISPYLYPVSQNDRGNYIAHVRLKEPINNDPIYLNDTFEDLSR